MQQVAKLGLQDKVSHAIEEIRVVLPGTQALLGFQFSTIFSNRFNTISQMLQYIHLISLFFITFATVFLMLPAAFHRIAEKGSDTDRLHTLSSNSLIIAMNFLVLGIISDIYIVCSIVTKNDILAFISSLFIGIVFYVIWFGYSLSKK
jgi:hypothetical protein